MFRSCRPLHKFNWEVKKILQQPQEARRINKRDPFCDKLKVLVSSGRGGDGRTAFLHIMNTEFAGPAGGNGGRGGHVYLVSTHKRQDLAHIKNMGYHISASTGTPGGSKDRYGAKGDDLILDVPIGTVAVDVDSNEVVHDLEAEGGVLLLEGGAGGKGNTMFAHSTHHSPRECTRGLPGNSMLVQFELKTIADVGLVGYPNAGKSSVLSAVSSSKPKIAAYPFTTLHPMVGQLHNSIGEFIRIADLPGLIEGAYANRGLGHQFLRHIERTKALVYVLDMSDPYIPGDRTTPQHPWEVLFSLQMELEYYMPGLSERAVMILANKMDVPEDENGVSTVEKLELLRARTTLPVFPISANLGLDFGVEDSRSGLPEALSALFPLAVSRRDVIGEKRKVAHNVILDEITARNDAKQVWLKGREEEEKEREREEEGAESESKPLEQEEDSPTSLVDHQMDMLGGDGGHTLVNNHSHYTPKSGRTLLARDQTLHGQYWQKTRGKGEKLRDEQFLWSK
eukprot:PhM_4_TR10354/c0_g1_i1/m.80254/K03979/obgE, cgtA; GTPase